MREMRDNQLSLLRGKWQPNAALACHTSWRVGGCAEYLYFPADLADLALFLQMLPPALARTCLGLGSNTLIRDGGIKGAVVVMQGGLIALQESAPQLIRAEAGISCAQLARYSARLGLTGLEFMAGIPGTVGGALVMNAGCFGGETWRYVHSVETIDHQGEIRVRGVAEFKVGYRHVERPLQEWFVAGYFQLQPGHKEQSLQQIRDLLERRNTTQPTGTANCGSVFRNPPGTYAGRLIEECGLKGKQIGGARVSEKHANFILNEANASALDIENLINEVRAIVAEKTGIQLLTEICIMGES